jgi:hypothetical protein
LVIQQIDLTDLYDLVIICHEYLVDPESLHGLDSELSVVLHKVGHHLLLVGDLNQHSDAVVILEVILLRGALIHLPLGHNAIVTVLEAEDLS